MSEILVDHEQVQKPPKILLEIGHSVRSLAAHSTMRFGPDLKYIGVELPADNKGAYTQYEATDEILTEYREAVTKKRAGENVEFRTADARHLNLEGNSVDTVFMANVVDSPLLYEDPISFDQLMLEARRVLKPDGELIFYEDRTPTQMDFRNRMLELLGFDVVERIEFGIDSAQSQRFEELKHQYGMHVNLALSRNAINEDTKRLISHTVNDNNYNPGDSESIKGDYFLILAKSKNEPQITSRSAETAYAISQKEWRESESARFTQEIEAQRENDRRAKVAKERERKELKKQFVIETGKLA